jgi:hypothetical protein
MKIDICYIKGGRSRGLVSEVPEDRQSALTYSFSVWCEGLEIMVAFDDQDEPDPKATFFQKRFQPIIVNEYVRFCMAHKSTYPRSAFLKSDIEAGLRIRTDAASRNLIDICVDGRYNADLYGRFYTLYAEEPFPFEGITSLLLQMEQVFDAINFPQSQTEHRRFNKEQSNRFITAQKGRNDHLKTKGAKGRQATFIVKVSFREHSTWQGTVTWVESQEESRFRSALELIRLIDSAVGTVEEEFSPETMLQEQCELYATKF